MSDAINVTIGGVTRCITPDADGIVTFHLKSSRRKRRGGVSKYFINGVRYRVISQRDQNRKDMKNRNKGRGEDR